MEEVRAVTVLLRATGVLALFLRVYIQYRILVHLHIRGLCCLSFISCPCKNLLKRRQLPQGCVRGGRQTLLLTFTLWCWSKKSSASFGVNLFPVILVLMESPTLLREDWEISSPPLLSHLAKVRLVDSDPGGQVIFHAGGSMTFPPYFRIAFLLL